MGQEVSYDSRFSSLSYSPVIESKKGICSEDRTLYNTPIHTQKSNTYVFTSPRTKPLPRGLQIMANNTVRLAKGFPYPKEILMCYGIDKNDWEKFQVAMFATLLVTNGDPKDRIPGRRVAYNIDSLLDVVSDWDVRYFRPKGLVIRMDMPGEEKYGLDFMDLYYKNHVLNASGIGSREGILEEYKKKRPSKRRQKHIDRARGRGYCSTRIVLDPVEVLQNKEKADVRGWTAWNRMCKEAKRRPLPPLRPNQAFNGDPRLRDRARKDRYPPCKYFYYDRFRGTENHVRLAHYPKKEYRIGNRSAVAKYYGHSAECKWVPEEDSMDQRYGGALYRCTILPVDDLPYVVVDDNHRITTASLMTRGFTSKDAANNDGPSSRPFWAASWRDGASANQSTCPWPDFPWPQGCGTERLDLVDGDQDTGGHEGTVGDQGRGAATLDLVDNDECSTCAWSDKEHGGKIWSTKPATKKPSVDRSNNLDNRGNPSPATLPPKKPLAGFAVASRNMPRVEEI